MYDSNLENELILPDIANVMTDHVSIQIDIDERKVKAAALVAQRIDIKRVIGQDNLDRVIDQANDASIADKQLRALIIPTLCYFTYYRCLTMFQGTFTDSGYITETEAETKSIAKSQASEIKGIAEEFMRDVIEFLEEEDPNTDATADKQVPNVRVFGGKECRGSN